MKKEISIEIYILFCVIIKSSKILIVDNPKGISRYKRFVYK